MAAIPLLIISDAVSAPTGLARIARDLAVRINKHLSDVYRVATFGFGGPGDASLNFPQYCAENSNDFMLTQIQEVWQNFAGNQKGVVLCIWDAGRLGWFAQPESSGLLSEIKYRGLRNWLAKPPFKKWLYCPVDASGPNSRMTFPVMKTLLGFDRILAYSEFGKSVIMETIGEENARVRNLDWLPHGIDGKVFTPSPERKMVRSVFPTLTQATSGVGFTAKAIADDERLVGIVATNQARKDWALGLCTTALLASSRDKIRLWIHTDAISRHWDLEAMLIDFQLYGERTLVSVGYIPDDQMADAYSACDVTFGIGPEGFGYPIAESQACGTPVITGAYGAGAELVPEECRVAPKMTRLEGVFSQERPVYHPLDWEAATRKMLGQRVQLDPKYYWKNLWPRWENYLMNAAKEWKA